RVLGPRGIRSFQRFKNLSVRDGKRSLEARPGSFDRDPRLGRASGLKVKPGNQLRALAQGKEVHQVDGDGEEVAKRGPAVKIEAQAKQVKGPIAELMRGADAAFDEGGCGKVRPRGPADLADGTDHLLKPVRTGADQLRIRVFFGHFRRKSEVIGDVGG